MSDRIQCTACQRDIPHMTHCPHCHPTSELASSAGSARVAMLQGRHGLRDPHWRDMTTEDRLLHACLWAYRKHVLMDDDIGWDRLGEILHNAICEAIGDDGFCVWQERMEIEPNIPDITK